MSKKYLIIVLFVVIVIIGLEIYCGREINNTNDNVNRPTIIVKPSPNKNVNTNTNENSNKNNNAIPKPSEAIVSKKVPEKTKIVTISPKLNSNGIVKAITTINFSTIPVCDNNLSLTGDGIHQQNSTWQIIATDIPTNMPCYYGPIKAVSPNAPSKVLDQKFYIYIE